MYRLLAGVNEPIWIMSYDPDDWKFVMLFNVMILVVPKR